MTGRGAGSYFELTDDLLQFIRHAGQLSSEKNFFDSCVINYLENFPRETVEDLFAARTVMICDGESAVLAESFGGDFDSGSPLPPFVFVLINHFCDLLDVFF